MSANRIKHTLFWVCTHSPDYALALAEEQCRRRMLKKGKPYKSIIQQREVCTHLQVHYVRSIECWYCYQIGYWNVTTAQGLTILQIICIMGLMRNSWGRIEILERDHLLRTDEYVLLHSTRTKMACPYKLYTWNKHTIPTFTSSCYCLITVKSASQENDHKTGMHMRKWKIERCLWIWCW